MSVAEAIESLDLYVQHGVPPGSFLLAVLSNNLVEAVSRADGDSALNIGPIVQYMCNRMPARSHGSLERVEAWVEQVRAKKSAQAAQA